jgi:hypothetical protein
MWYFVFNLEERCPVGIRSDSSRTYSIGPGGERREAHAKELRMNGQIIYQMDENSGVLRVCASPEDVTKLIGMMGGLPRQEVILPGLLGEQMHFFNVSNIESISTEDKSFLVHLS